MAFLDEDEARVLVDDYMRLEGSAVSTQDILDSGAISRLQGYIAKPGKVSDSIFGGKGSYFDKKRGERVEFENPPLTTSDGVPIRLMVRSERISTHDINRGVIAFKDQVLAVNHHFMLRLLARSLGNSQFDVDGLNDNGVVIAAENLTPIPLEFVLRRYMAKSTTSTSLYSAYMMGNREFAGHFLPEGLIANGILPYLIDTPSTKSEEHDETISERKALALMLCSAQQYNEMRSRGFYGFGIADEFFSRRNVILADTKLEFGVNSKGEVVVQDEVINMDSSRFWLRDDYEQQLGQLRRGEIFELSPKSYSKEFARGFSKGDLGYTDEERAQIAVRYILGIQHLLGSEFLPDKRSWEERVVDGLERAVQLVMKH